MTPQLSSPLSRFLLICFSLLLSNRVHASDQAAGVLTGKVSAPGLSNTVVKLYTTDGRELQSFVQPDGTFEFTGVPAGSHLLQAFQIGYFFPEVRVDMSAKSGPIRAIIVGQQKPLVLPFPLTLQPLGQLQYYEKRKPVDIMSFVKSPYGLMIVFSVFMIFVIPKMKVDPEELREVQAQLRGDRRQEGGQQQQQRIADRS